MSAIAPTLQAFFTERLITQQQASPHTITAYRDTFRLVLEFVTQRCGKPAAALDFENLDAETIGAFLTHLETGRGNGVRTRNARLAAIHSLFSFAALRHPEHAALIQRVLAIPRKHYDDTLVCYLDADEINALLAAPDRDRWIGRRDRTLLAVAVETGLRVSELTGLRRRDVHLGAGAHVRCLGKGRKHRCTPLTSQTVEALKTWLAERGGQADDPVFPTSRGGPLTTDAVRLRVAEYAGIAARRCPSLKAKTVTPHTLRHSAAMALLHAGTDTSVIALWLGHAAVATTYIYVHADLAMKERALARTTPPNVTPGRYRAPDTLLAFLTGL
jgi:integrase/recombinase XerD